MVWFLKTLFLPHVHVCSFVVFYLAPYFPECVARVPVSLWGSGGWRCVRSTMRLRPQPFANVRGRSREACMAVPMVSSAKGVTFGDFDRRVASFRVAGLALCEIPTCFITRRRSFCVADTILFASVWQAQDFGDFHHHFPWQVEEHCRCVMLRVFTNHIVRAVSSGDNVQIPRQPWWDENWRKLCMKHRFWGSKFWGSWKNSWEMLILKLRSMKKWGNFVWNARFEALISFISIFWFFEIWSYLWGKLQNLFEGFPLEYPLGNGDPQPFPRYLKFMDCLFLTKYIF